MFTLEPDIMLSNMVPFESVELEYHDEWIAWKSPSMMVCPSSSSDDPEMDDILLCKSFLGGM